MKRRLFNAGAAVSLGLCLVSVVLWARGWQDPEQLVYDRWEDRPDGGEWHRRIAIGLGHAPPHRLGWGVRIITLDWNEIESSLAESAAGRHLEEILEFTRTSGWKLEPQLLPSLGNTYGLWVRWLFLGGHRSAHVSFPLWALVMLTALAPGAAIFRIWRHRSINAVTCPACGYDLRGTPSRDSGGKTCPECGAVLGVATP